MDISNWLIWFFASIEWYLVYNFLATAHNAYCLPCFADVEQLFRIIISEHAVFLLLGFYLYYCINSVDCMTHITRIGPVTVTILATRPPFLGLFSSSFNCHYGWLEDMLIFWYHSYGSNFGSKIYLFPAFSKCARFNPLVQNNSGSTHMNGKKTALGAGPLRDFIPRRELRMQIPNGVQLIFLMF